MADDDPDCCRTTRLKTILEFEDAMQEIITDLRVPRVGRKMAVAIRESLKELRKKEGL